MLGIYILSPFAAGSHSVPMGDRKYKIREGCLRKEIKEKLGSRKRKRGWVSMGTLRVFFPYLPRLGEVIWVRTYITPFATTEGRRRKNISALSLDVRSGVRLRGT